ncbi:MAG: GtrA family protein [Candidatus Symbiobacter sp.]|nr:GtrA family protein [Candidatus Symbiobacter sp.]
MTSLTLGKSLFTTNFRQITVYLIVSLITILFDVGTMYGLMTLGVNAVAAASAGFLVAFVVNFVLHMRVTFVSHHSLAIFIKFSLVVFINYLVTLAFVEAAIFLANDALAGKMISLPVVSLIGFVLCKIWVFK